VGAISSIDTNKVDSMLIWYSLTNDSADFSDKTFTKVLAMQEVTKAVVNNQYPFNIVNTSFYSAKQTIHCAVMLKGKNGRTSPVKKYQFIVGLDRPANPITLQAKALSGTRIRLSWNNVSAANVERIFIWFRKNTPVDTVYDVSALKLDTIVPSAVTDTVVIGDKFNPTTVYYFGAQVFKGGLWSQITTNASATATTPAAGAPLDSSTIKALDFKTAGPVFDTATNTIKIGWTVNRSAIDSLDIGISYSTVSAAADTVVGQIVQSNANADSAVVKLHENLVFNANYYVKLWLRRPGGKWTDPGQNSAGVVRTPSFTWQSVTYFSKENDTVYAFNREIRLLNQPGDRSLTANVVRYVSPPILSINGLIPVSIGVDFQVKDRGYPFYIGLRVDSLPPGSLFSDVRIYRDSAGLLLLAREPIVYDSANRYVSILTNDLDFPFVAMIDTNNASGVPLLIPYEPKATAERRPLLQWHSVNGASTYNLIVADNVNFSNPIFSIPLSDTAFKATADLPFSTIFWKIKSNLSSKWSKVDQFVVQPDSIPFLIRYNGTTVSTRKPVFTWHPVTNALDYTIKIADNRNFTNAISVRVIDTLFLPLADLSQGLWYWTVSCSRSYALFTPFDSVNIDTAANSVIKSAAIVKPFFKIVQSRSGISFLFGGYNRGEMAVEIYSLKGQLVNSFSCSVSKTNALIWNYNDRSGRRVTNGMYIFRIVTPDKVIKTKVLVSR
jgi:hypothetical protein